MSWNYEKKPSIIHNYKITTLELALWKIITEQFNDVYISNNVCTRS